MNEKLYGGLALAQLRAIEQAASKGPWRECGATTETCKCGTVWTVAGDHPVATAVSGAWGDEYPALRFVESDGTPAEGTSLSARVEAYAERIEYGSIPAADGSANAQVIAAARNALPAAGRDRAAECAACCHRGAVGRRGARDVGALPPHCRG